MAIYSRYEYDSGVIKLTPFKFIESIIDSGEIMLSIIKLQKNKKCQSRKHCTGLSSKYIINLIAKYIPHNVALHIKYKGIGIPETDSVSSNCSDAPLRSLLIDLSLFGSKVQHPSTVLFVYLLVCLFCYFEELFNSQPFRRLSLKHGHSPNNMKLNTSK